MKIDQLEQFFEERPAINKSVFAKECGISRQYLLMILDHKRPLTEQTAGKILPVMKKYGWVKKTSER
jgi:hypothetical protein